MGGRGSTSRIGREKNKSKTAVNSAKTKIEANSKTQKFDSRNNIINALKEQTNVDISKAIDDERFSTKRRTYFDIDSRKLNQNEFNAMMKYLKYDNNVRIEENGAYHYAIYYKKNKRR